MCLWVSLSCLNISFVFILKALNFTSRNKLTQFCHHVKSLLSGIQKDKNAPWPVGHHHAFTVEDLEGTCGAASELERELASFEWPYSHYFCKVHNKASQAGNIAINICVPHSDWSPLPNLFSADAEQLADLVFCQCASMVDKKVWHITTQAAVI